MYHKQNSEWVGEDCTENPVRAQDVINTVSQTFEEGVSALDDTLLAIVRQGCPNGDCGGVVDISPVLEGNKTAGEVAQSYFDGLVTNAVDGV